MNQVRAIKIAITALGGQGGGVLAGWIVTLGERNGFIAQSTSVPGVAQRTGATVYYIELFPQGPAQARSKVPVLALMPVPGDVDIVMSAELMEAGRAMMRGFITSETTLITSLHRDYAIAEKIKMGDGRQAADSVLEAAQKIAGKFIAADMAQAATETGTVISSVLFGALAGSGALPIDRASFQDVIRSSGRAVESNLRGFDRGFEIAQSGECGTVEKATEKQIRDVPSLAVAPLLDRLHREFPAPVHYWAREGLKRVVDFQDVRYGDVYLDRLERLLQVDISAGGDRRDYALTQALAKHLALWMSYEDSIRVADLKSRASRFERFRQDVKADHGQIVDVYEYLHPRVEEVCDVLPNGLARMLLGSNALIKILSRLIGKGRRVPTTKMRGYFPLYFLSSLRGMRRGTYRFKLEDQRIENWIALILEAGKADYALAVEVVRIQRLIKGYGETHERGLGNFNLLIAALGAVRLQPAPAVILKSLSDAALTDEDGVALRAALDQFYEKNSVAAA